MTPRLTIAIPTLNRAELLGRAIESALAQTARDIEIVVSDNGSVDDTPAVVARYAGRGLRTFRHNSTMSAQSHGSFLVQQAQGEYFLGLSDDDFLEPEFAEETLAMFERNPKLSFVYTGCAVHYEDRQVPAAVGPPTEEGLSFLAAHYGDAREVCWCACVTRVRDLKELCPIPEDRILGDMFFWTKLAFRGPVGCVPRVLSNYVLFRSRNDNISHATSPVIWAREARVLADEVIQRARERGVPIQYLSAFQAECKHHISRSIANQFVWTRVRGASLTETWQWTASCLPYLSWDFSTVTRFGAALLLPRAVLRNAVLNGISKLSASRAKNAPIKTAHSHVLSSSE